MGQESGSGLVGWLWLKVSHKFAVKRLAGACHQQASLRLKGLFSRWFPHVAVGKRLLFLPLGLSETCFSVLMEWQLASMSAPSETAPKEVDLDLTF